MDLSTMRDNVYRDLAEASIGNDRVTADQITKALNDAYVDIAARTGCFARSATIAKESGYYPVPSDAISVRHVVVTGGTVSLNQTTVKKLDIIAPDWRGAVAGNPAYFFLYDQTRIGVYPTTDTSIDAELLVVPVASGTFPTLSADTDSPSLMVSDHMTLVHGAVAALCGRFLLDNQEAQLKAQAAQQAYEAGVQAIMAREATGVGLTPSPRMAAPQG
jgi:hypothetical protein